MNLLHLLHLLHLHRALVPLTSFIGSYPTFDCYLFLVHTTVYRIADLTSHLIRNVIPYLWGTARIYLIRSFKLIFSIHCSSTEKKQMSLWTCLICSKILGIISHFLGRIHALSLFNTCNYRQTGNASSPRNSPQIRCHETSEFLTENSVENILSDTRTKWPFLCKYDPRNSPWERHMFRELSTYQ